MLLLSLLLQAQLPDKHPPLSKAAPSVAEMVKKLDATPGLEAHEKSFEVAASLGRLYFSQGRYAKATTYYTQAVTKAAAVHALYAKYLKMLGRKTVPSTGCEVDGQATQAQLLEKGRQYLAATQTAQALACLKLAMTTLGGVRTSLGHAQFLSGEVDAALATYTRAIAWHEDAPEAHYARGALLLDVKADDLDALRQARRDLQHFLQTAPTAVQAAQARRFLSHIEKIIAAGGLAHVTREAASAAPKPSQKTSETFRSVPRTPQMKGQFMQLITQAEDYLAHGHFQKALENYRQVMPFQPDNPRLRAGMAWTMLQLKRQPMADRVWRVAAENPEAIATLGDVLHAKGDAAGAESLWLRLKRTVPSYAPQLEGRLAKSAH